MQLKCTSAYLYDPQVQNCRDSHAIFATHKEFSLVRELDRGEKWCVVLPCQLLYRVNLFWGCAIFDVLLETLKQYIQSQDSPKSENPDRS